MAWRIIFKFLSIELPNEKFICGICRKHFYISLENGTTIARFTVIISKVLPTMRPVKMTIENIEGIQKEIVH